MSQIFLGGLLGVFKAPNHTALTKTKQIFKAKPQIANLLPTQVGVTVSFTSFNSFSTTSECDYHRHLYISQDSQNNDPDSYKI